MNTGATNYIDLVCLLRFEAAMALKHKALDCAALYHQAADAIERALPAITSWNSPDALRTRISMLTQNPYSPTDSCDSPEAPLT